MALNYIDEIARLVRAEIAPEARPAERADDLYRLYALLVLVKGEATTPADVHNAWSVWMLPQDPTHSSLRPFGQLDENTKQEDLPFVDAIHEVARSLSSAPMGDGSDAID
ncbi:MAG: hypothetical protein IT193_12615 [Propionibacteriaceae bacterium]|nr:hypothetical protein [Propionibacteriaceae bacterium]